MARELNCVVELEIGQCVTHRAMAYAPANEQLHGVVVRYLIGSGDSVAYGVEWEHEPSGLSFHPAEALQRIETDES